MIQAIILKFKRLALGVMNTLAIKSFHPFLKNDAIKKTVAGKNPAEQVNFKERPISKPPYKFIVVLLFLIITTPAFAYTNDQIADAIYQAENSVKFPYGIKSINTHGNKEYARRICLNTIRNNRKRFSNQTKYKDYIEFLGSRFCPPTAHKLNVNWVRNVRYFLTKDNQ